MGGHTRGGTGEQAGLVTTIGYNRLVITCYNLGYNQIVFEFKNSQIKSMVFRPFWRHLRGDCFGCSNERRKQLKFI